MSAANSPLTITPATANTAATAVNSITSGVLDQTAAINEAAKQLAFAVTCFPGVINQLIASFLTLREIEWDPSYDRTKLEFELSPNHRTASLRSNRLVSSGDFKTPIIYGLLSRWPLSDSVDDTD